MNNKSYVILIDDNVDFAREYSETLQSICGTTVLYATSAPMALKLIKENPVKVAIIDQVMPVKGTVLFKEIKAIEPLIKTILLTAEAERHDLTEATNIGFDVTLLKEESDMEILPSKVLMLIAKYNSQRFDNSTSVLITKQKKWFQKANMVKYYVQHYNILDEKYIDTNGWSTRNIVEKGESLTFEEEIDVETEFNYTESFRIENEDVLGLNINDLLEFKNSLSSKMATDFTNTYTESLKKIIKRKRILDLPKEQENIISRSYEYTKVYQQIEVYVKKECSCCNDISITPITVYLPIPIIQYRIIEYFSDGSSKETLSGELKA